MSFITNCRDSLPMNLFLSPALKKHHTLLSVVSRLLFYYLPPPVTTSRELEGELVMPTHTPFL